MDELCARHKAAVRTQRMAVKEQCEVRSEGVKSRGEIVTAAAGAKPTSIAWLERVKQTHPAAAKALKRMTKQLIEMRSSPLGVFHWLDRDGSGSLSPKEVARGLGSIGLSLDSKDLKSVVRLFDTNADGEISFDEFGPPLQLAFDYRLLKEHRRLMGEDVDESSDEDLDLGSTPQLLVNLRGERRWKYMTRRIPRLRQELRHQQ